MAHTAQTPPPTTQARNSATTSQLQPHMHQALHSLDSVDLLATLRGKASQFQKTPFPSRTVPGGSPFRTGTHSSRGHRNRFRASMDSLVPPPLDALAVGPKEHGPRPNLIGERASKPFSEGKWFTLLAASLRSPSSSAGTAVPPTALNSAEAPTDRRRRERARHLVRTGRPSAARQALTAGPLAPGTPTTLASLWDPDRRQIGRAHV